MSQIDFYKELGRLHDQYCPEWRFGQLLSNLQVFYHIDLFYMTDEEILELIQDFFER